VKILPPDAAPRARIAVIRFIGVLYALFAAVGCVGGPGSISRKPESSRATITAAGPQVDATGPAAAPANVTRTVQTIPLPAGSKIEVTPPAAPDAPRPAPVVFSLPAPATVTTTTETATAPKSYAPPSPAETAAAAATASGVRYFWIAGLAALLAAGLAAWSGHYLAAVCLGAAGLALPVLAQFVSRASALGVGLALAGLAAGLVAAWYVIQRRAHAS
jgi:hypothetical protein